MALKCTHSNKFKFKLPSCLMNICFRSTCLQCQLFLIWTAQGHSEYTDCAKQTMDMQNWLQHKHSLLKTQKQNTQTQTKSFINKTHISSDHPLIQASASAVFLLPQKHFNNFWRIWKYAWFFCFVLFFNKGFHHSMAARWTVLHYIIKQLEMCADDTNAPATGRLDGHVQTHKSTDRWTREMLNVHQHFMVWGLNTHSPPALSPLIPL